MSESFESFVRKLTIFVLLVFAILVLFGILRTDASAAPVAGGGPSLCYGVRETATVVKIAPSSLIGVRIVTAEIASGPYAGDYSLKSTRQWRLGQSVTVHGNVCDGWLYITRFN